MGPHTHGRYELVARGRIDEVAVFFQPQGFYRLFHEPTALFAGLGIDAEAVFGRRMRQLHDRLGEAEEFAARVRILDGFLVDYLEHVRVQDHVSQALDRLITCTDGLTIESAAAAAKLSVRQLERRSLEHAGVAPKKLCRIARFERALWLKRMTHASWTAIAHALDYHDQMHLIHDFHALAGDTPNKLMTRIRSDYLMGIASVE